MVPELAVREVCGRHRAQLTEIVGDAERWINKLDRLGIASHPPDVDIESESQKYEAELRSTLQAAKVATPVPPAVELLDLVDRAIARRRPFNDSGGGFRDALIWEHLCQEVQEFRRPAVLISNDRKAFNEGGDLPVLHSHLRDDLRRRGMQTDAIQLYFSLTDFLTQTGVSDPALTAEVAELVVAVDAQIRANLAVALEQASVSVGAQLGRGWIQQGFAPAYLAVTNVVSQEESPDIALVQLEAEGDADIYVESYDGRFPQTFSTSETLLYEATATYDRQARTLDNISVGFVELDLERIAEHFHSTPHHPSMFTSWED